MGNNKCSWRHLASNCITAHGGRQVGAHSGRGRGDQRAHTSLRALLIHDAVAAFSTCSPESPIGKERIDILRESGFGIQSKQGAVAGRASDIVFGLDFVLNPAICNAREYCSVNGSAC